MSYTPQDQLLTPGLNTIVDGIDTLCAAIDERVSSDPCDWTEAHLDEITELAAELTVLKNRLCRLRRQVR